MVYRLALRTETPCVTREFGWDNFDGLVLVSVGRVPGWHEMESVWWERSMNGQEERTDRANDTAARVIAYLSPYLFWAVVGAIVGGIVLLQA